MPVDFAFDEFPNSPQVLASSIEPIVYPSKHFFRDFRNPGIHIYEGDLVLRLLILLK